MVSEKGSCVESNGYDSNLLIRISLLTKGPLLARRKEIQKSLVIAGLQLYKPEDIFETNDLAANITKITRCKIDDGVIISILSELTDEKILTHIEGLKYKLNKKVEVPDLSGLLTPAWNEFLLFLKNQYSEYDSYIDKDARVLFEWSMIKLLTRFVDATGPSLENQLEMLPLDDFKSIITENVKDRFLSEILSKTFSTIFCSYLTSKQPILLKILFDFYSSIINIDLVLREQEIPKINFENLRFLVVDTPFIVGLLCKTEPIHPLSIAVAKRCLNSQIQLFYTSKTKKEMGDFINGSKKEMTGVLQPSKKYKPIRSQFVADFRRQKNISWPDYVVLLQSWEQLFEKNWKTISIPKELEDMGIDEDIANYVKKILPILDNLRNEARMSSDPNYQPHYRDEPQIEHDAYCIGLVSRIRNDSDNKEKKLVGPWFLTFDNLLSTLSAAYSGREGGFGFVLQPRTLLNYLLIYSKIQFDEQEKEEVAEAIIRFTARTPDPILTIDEYSRLLTFKVGLEESDIKIVKEILLASPLLEEMRRALEMDRGDSADDVAYRIISDNTFVNIIIGERKTKEKFQRVAAKLQETNAEWMKERAAREALERTKNQYISITTSVTMNVELTIQNEFKKLISLLEAENAFKEGLLEKPSDVSTKDKLKGWLEKAKSTIETTRTISEGIKSLLPYILYLIAKLEGT